MPKITISRKLWLAPYAEGWMLMAPATKKNKKRPHQVLGYYASLEHASLAAVDKIVHDDTKSGDLSVLVEAVQEAKRAVVAALKKGGDARGRQEEA